MTTPKGRHARVVPMTTRLAAALEVIVKRSSDPSEPRVLLKPDGTRPTYQTVRSWMRTVQRHAGMIDNGRMHVLRHTFCSHLAMRGATLIAIKELAGHEHASTTLRYMHLATGERIRTIGLLEPGGSNAGATRETL